MPDPVSTTILSFLGAKAGEVLVAVVKDHVRDFVNKLLGKGGKMVLGAEEAEEAAEILSI